MKKIKVIKGVKNVLDAVLVIDANSASSCFAYQDKVPAEIKKFKKVK